MFFTKNNILYNKIIIGSLILIFIVYNWVVYTDAAFIKKEKLSPQALTGQLLWQDNNCTACHQMYGLGGYLGPDLTNIASDSLKSDLYIKAMINAGKNAMPQYHFSEKDLNAFIAFFKAVDRTGYFPNKTAKTSLSGWVELTKKNGSDEK